MHITPARIVLYRLSATDAEQINRRRTTGKSIAARMSLDATEGRWPQGAQAHIGNAANEGDILPLLVVRTWTNGPPDAAPECINGQVFLDGNDTLWVTSVHEGTEPGTWAWPART